MIHAYDELYISCAQTALGSMLDYMVNDLTYPIETAWQIFLSSSICGRFERGDCSIIAGRSGYELAYMILEESGKTRPSTMPTQPYDRSPAYWTGWAIAWYQRETGLRFEDITHAVSIRDVQDLYDPYHEMDIRQFGDRMNELYLAATPDTHLKARRLAAGLSQSDLARRADVPVRTIQQYEQRQKDINKAQAHTLLQLSSALYCNVEDLLEMIPGERHANSGSFLDETMTTGRVAEKAAEFGAKT